MASMASTTDQSASAEPSVTAASSQFPTTVLPGDDLTPQILNSSIKSQPKLGTGLRYDPSSRTVTATLAGRLCHRHSTSTYLVLTNTRRYVPALNDRVLAIVEERAGPEYYRVNIFGPHPALLHHLAFEGATKRNKPQLKPGTLLYCRITAVGPDFDPEVSCKVGGDGLADGGAARKDWMTDESTYGELKGGTCQRISLGLARELLLPTSEVLTSLGKAGLPFEVCVGVNGVVWVHSSRPEYTVLILNAVRNSEVMTVEQVRGMVKSLVKTVKSQLDDD